MTCGIGEEPFFIKLPVFKNKCLYYNVGNNIANLRAVNTVSKCTWRHKLQKVPMAALRVICAAFRPTSYWAIPEKNHTEDWGYTFLKILPGNFKFKIPCLLSIDIYLSILR